MKRENKIKLYGYLFLLLVFVYQLILIYSMIVIDNNYTIISILSLVFSIVFYLERKRQIEMSLIEFYIEKYNKGTKMEVVKNEIE